VTLSLVLGAALLTAALTPPAAESSTRLTRPGPRTTPPAPPGAGSAGRLSPFDPRAAPAPPLRERLLARACSLRRRRTAGESLGREEVADLVGRLAALTRAGVAPGRAWQVLAMGTGPGAGIARVTADMAASGGSTADGLRLAADTWPRTQAPAAGLAAVGWLALATDVIDRSGAPSAVVHEGLAAGILAELARLDEQEVALAGARTTAKLLAALPLVGAALGYLMGANVLGVLLGSTAGRTCLVLGTTCWIAGRLWTAHLVKRASAV
jgi:tight adherence protein B